jgi:guanosine-3',5'-bis(diphosphate) 3'-pyrophosphohydrolase
MLAGVSESPEPHRRYVEAVLWAMEKHRIQVRRDGTPYIAHPLRVAESLRTIAGVADVDVLIAGLLHDVIEDTECDYDAIESRFGARVAGLVAELTADMRLPKEARRRDQIEKIRHASGDAKKIKLADRYDNVTDMKGFSEKRRSEYIAQSRAVLEACRGASPALEERFAEALAGLSE